MSKPLQIMPASNGALIQWHQRTTRGCLASNRFIVGLANFRRRTQQLQLKAGYLSLPILSLPILSLPILSEPILSEPILSEPILSELIFPLSIFPLPVSEGEQPETPIPTPIITTAHDR